jgi:hypothetical protein
LHLDDLLTKPTKCALEFIIRDKMGTATGSADFRFGINLEKIC